MRERKNFSSGGPWEDVAGYSRAVRVGPFVYVSGTTATNSQGEVNGDAYAQTKEMFKIIERALKEAGASLKDVVRTRMYITDMSNAEQVCTAHREVFHAIRPAATLVEVSRLIKPEILIEIECDAIVQE